MIVSKYKEDYIEVDEKWLIHNHVPTERKIHLVKLCFNFPCEEMMDQVLDLLPKTNRFIIENNVKFYNSYFKQTKKKYYVENTLKDEKNFISFLRKNNKILLNLKAISNVMLKYFILELVFEDVLRNVEIIKMDKEDYIERQDMLKEWSGNVIILE